MSGGVNTRKRILILVLLGTGIVFLYFFFTWYWPSHRLIYRLPEVRLIYHINEDGTVDVEERITYLMKRPYRGVYYEYSIVGRPTLSDVQVHLENKPLLRVEWLRRSSKSISFRAWVNETPTAPSNGGDILVLVVKYKLYNALDRAIDTVQFFNRAIWRGGWELPVNEMIVEVRPASPVNFVGIYPSGLRYKAENQGSSLLLSITGIPSKTQVGMRLLLSPDAFSSVALNNMAYLNESFSSLISRSNLYLEKARRVFVVHLVLVLLVPLALLIVYLTFGREPKTGLDIIYERELPSDDPPELVNAVVKRYCSKPDGDGLISAILKLVQKKALEFVVEKSKVIGLKILDPSKFETPEDRLILKLFFDGREKSGAVTYWESLKADFDDKERAKGFVSSYSAWKTLVGSKAKGLKYMVTTGAILATVTGVLGLFISIYLAFAWISGNLSEFSVAAARMAYVVTPFLAVLGLAPVILPRDIFARWSKRGREYYLRWKAFERFLRDFSLLSTYPPDSIKVWENYLVYGTALGLADTVSRSMKELVPREEMESMSLPPVVVYDRGWYHGPRGLFVHAYSKAYEGSGKGSDEFGGSSFGGGGGGFGGTGGGGAF
ncbi:MAG TPA: hypothetical protein DHV12_02365 [Thermotogae bacterium]|nr:hypothetical protein [Thermotogota bacterium]